MAAGWLEKSIDLNCAEISFYFSFGGQNFDFSKHSHHLEGVSLIKIFFDSKRKIFLSPHKFIAGRGQVRGNIWKFYGI